MIAATEPHRRAVCHTLSLPVEGQPAEQALRPTPEGRSSSDPPNSSPRSAHPARSRSSLRRATAKGNPQLKVETPLHLHYSQ